MFDKWEGDYGYLKANDNIVWTMVGTTPRSENAINICGAATPDPKYNAYVEAIIPHESSMISLEFGSSLLEDPCTGSYGIDDVVIYAM